MKEQEKLTKLQEEYDDERDKQTRRREEDQTRREQEEKERKEVEENYQNMKRRPENRLKSSMNSETKTPRT